VRQRGQHRQIPFEARHFADAGVFDGLTDVVAAAVVLENGGAQDVSNWARCFLADGQRFREISVLHQIADSFHEIFGVNVRPMQMEESFQRYGDCDHAAKHDEPHENAADV
jgi:hypothetical protein